MTAHHPFPLWPFTSLALLLLYLLLPSHSLTHEIDKAALDAFYHGLTNKGTQLPSVLPEGYDWCVEQANIGCTSDGKATIIDLSFAQLMGTISPLLGNLTELVRLELLSNELTGTIPSTLGNLPKLATLYLVANRLTGTIPSTLGNLVQLEELLLYANQLTGSIPASLGKLLQLQILMLTENRLIGSIPSILVRLTQLQHLDLSNNQLTGTIPSILITLPNLKKLLLKGTNNFCPLEDYRDWAEETDFPGSTECAACADFTCQGNGRCSGGNNQLFNCTCHPGWMGKNCETPDPTPTPSPSSIANRLLGGGGAVAGIAIGSVLGILLLFGLGMI